MAESPCYVNVKSREERLSKHSKPQRYRNVSLSVDKDCDAEGYQTVHERGLDPNGEYTDLTQRTCPDEDDDAILQRERMINDLLFPPQKNAPRRFNYTDIRLSPVRNDEEDLPPPDISGHSSIDLDSNKHSNSSKPKIKPKPKLIEKKSHSEDNICMATEASLSECGSHQRCTISCKYCTKEVVYLVLLMVCISISVVAVAVAVVAIVRPSRACEETYVYEDCAITPVQTLVDEQPQFLGNNCTTPPIALLTKGTKVGSYMA